MPSPRIALVWQYIGSKLAYGRKNHYPQSSNQSHELEQRSKTRNGRDLLAKGPGISLYIWFLLTVLGGFILCLLGGLYFNYERRILGAALLGIGFLLGAAGFLIWWPSHTLIWQLVWGWLL